MKYWWLYVIGIIGLWYAFGRKWLFMYGCKNSDYTEEYLSSTTPEQRKQRCKEQYDSFTKSSSVNWMPVAWH